jgi:hypothetical protein
MRPLIPEASPIFAFSFLRYRPLPRNFCAGFFIRPLYLSGSDAPVWLLARDFPFASALSR